MTPAIPGLAMRDAQILELLRAGAPVTRVVAIGRHRDTWNEAHVGNVVASHFGPKPPEPDDAPKRPLKLVKPTREPAPCGTHAGYAKHRRDRTKVCNRCRSARNAYTRDLDAGKREAELTEWRPEPFTGRATRVRVTPEQTDVLGLLCKGLSNGQISARLNVPVETIKSRVAKLMLLTGATGRVHLAAMVLSGQVHLFVDKPDEVAS